MGYYKSCHSRERFSSPLRQFPWASFGLTRYLPKLCTHNVTKANNDQRETKWFPVLSMGVQTPYKTRSTTSDFSRFPNPVRDKKRHNEWVKRINRVIVV